VFRLLSRFSGVQYGGSTIKPVEIFG